MTTMRQQLNYRKTITLRIYHVFVYMLCHYWKTMRINWNFTFIWGKHKRRWWPSFLFKPITQSIGVAHPLSGRIGTRERTNKNQPIYSVEAGIWTWATLVGGKCSHHCAILAPQAKTVKSFHLILVFLAKGQITSQYVIVFQNRPFCSWAIGTKTQLPKIRSICMGKTTFAGHSWVVFFCPCTCRNFLGGLMGFFRVNISQVWA